MFTEFDQLLVAFMRRDVDPGLMIVSLSVGFRRTKNVKRVRHENR